MFQWWWLIAHQQGHVFDEAAAVVVGEVTISEARTIIGIPQFRSNVGANEDRSIIGEADTR